MAIWQFKTLLIPERAVVARYGQIPVTIPTIDNDEIDWWAADQPLAGFEAEISDMLREAKPWNEEMRVWGDEVNDTDMVWVFYTDATRTAVKLMEFRFDARDLSKTYVEKFLRFAARHVCVIVDARLRRLMTPDPESFSAGWSNSFAKRFLKDPVATLTNMPPIGESPETDS